MLFIGNFIQTKKLNGHPVFKVMYYLFITCDMSGIIWLFCYIHLIYFDCQLLLARYSSLNSDTIIKMEISLFSRYIFTFGDS